MSDVAAPPSAPPSSNSPAPSAPAAAPAAASKAPAAKAATPTPTAKPSASPAQNTAATMKSVQGGQGGQGEAETSNAADNAAAAREAAKEVQKLKIKYKANKEEIEEELTHEEIATRMSKLKGSERAFQERAEMQKAVQEFLTALKEDPFAALSDPTLGVDLEAIAEERLKQKYQRMVEEQRLTPEQLEARKAKEEATKYKQQLEQIEAQKRAVQQQEFQKRVDADVESRIIKALELAGIEPSIEAIRESAAIMKLNREQYKMKLTSEQIAAEVKRRFEDKHSKYFKGKFNNVKGEALLNLLGDDVVKEVLRARLEKIQKPEAFDRPAPTPSQQTESEKKEKFDIAAWRRENIYGGRG